MAAASKTLCLNPLDNVRVALVELAVSSSASSSAACGFWGQQAAVIRGNNLRNGGSVICRMLVFVNK